MGNTINGRVTKESITNVMPGRGPLKPAKNRSPGDTDTVQFLGLLYDVDLTYINLLSM